MRAHYLQHVSFEGLGSIEAWLKGAGYEVTGTRFFEAAARLPSVQDIDMLVIMGGPMSVNEEDQFPWLVEEKRFVRAAIEAGVPTLGVCLGAQMIASALGGKVFPNHTKEIGWFPIQSVAATQAGVFQFPSEVEVFHWHGETFSLPAGAIRLAKSAACENQAFQIGRNAIGLQFHLETTPESAQAIVDNCRDELVAGQYIQSEATILAADAARYAAINRLMGQLLDYLRR